MITAIVVSILVLGGCFGAFVLALNRRWFARMERGFLVTLWVALGGAGLITAALLGTLGYQAAREILFNEVVEELESVGKVVEAEIHDNIRIATKQLGNLADVMAPEMARVDSKHVRERFRDLQRLNEWWLQINLYDQQGVLAVSSSAAEAAEPANRVAVAYGLEGKPFASDAYFSSVFKKYVLYLSAPVRGAGGAPLGVLSLRYALQEDLAGHVGSARFGQTGRSVLTDNDGRIVAHADPARISEDISTYPAVQQGRQDRAGWVLAKNKAGEERLSVYRPVRSPATINPKPWVLLTEIEAREALAPLGTLWDEIALAVGVFAVVSLVLGYCLSLYVKRPVQTLLQLVRRVRDGDLTGHATITGRDEMGQLAEALTNMIRGLQERDRVKELFGRYLTTQVSEEVLKGQIDLGGRVQRASILFSDIRNFTAMSETMTPEQVVTFLNDYFSEMVEAVFEHGGVLDKYIGDSIMATFGSLDNSPDHPRRAVLTALRMKALLAKINGERAITGKPPIGIGIGIHTDDVIVGNIGSRKRLEYTVIGDGVNTCSRLQALNKEFGTTILITETTYETVRDEFECRQMPETPLRGKAKPLQFYEVISAKAK